MRPRYFSVFKAVIFTASLFPLIHILGDATLGRLSANPIEDVTQRTGFWTLTFLMLTLSVTPIRQMTGWNQLIRLRRMLGLFAYTYAALHFSIYIVLDQFFAWSFILEDIGERPYITVGFTALVLLTPLALTSTARMIRRLGGKRWFRLHRLVYVAASLGVLHFWWLVKADTAIPLRFAVVLSLLLGFRLVRWAFLQRRSRSPAGSAATRPSVRDRVNA